MTDTSELVERLQSHMGQQDRAILLADCRAAADTIERLTRELAEARSMLEVPFLAGYERGSSRRTFVGLAEQERPR